MSINWIATNPRSNTKNKTNQISMSDAEFETLMRMIIHVRLTFLFIFLFQHLIGF